MGKRSEFERRDRDFYPTPKAAVVPLMPHLPPFLKYHEPCAGDGALINALNQLSAEHRRPTICVAASDIEPSSDDVRVCDVMDITECAGDVFITNTPWPGKRAAGEPTVSMALHLSNLAPTWMLLAADFAHARYFVASGLYSRCERIVSVGRVSWMQNGTSGLDNAAWYLFDANHDGATTFVARAA
jgi:hypothetical protein